MPGRFATLIERIAAPPPPPRVVTPDEYRVITCNRCGLCCEDIRTARSPEELMALRAHPFLDPDSRAFLAGLLAVAPVIGGWRYRCRHFGRDADGLGRCTVHATRPAVCRGFPFGRVVRTWPQCAWYVEIRDGDGTVLNALPEAGDGAVGR